MTIFAHRGYSGRFPENTMLAFQKAVDEGCDGIELDVQMTKDGNLVVIHDEQVDRTTDGTGFVKDFTFADLRALDAAKAWNGKFAKQQVPSFEEYCEWAADKKIVTNIELKTSVVYYEDIEKKTIDLVAKYGLEKRVLFSSFNHLSIVNVKQIAPEFPVGALVEEIGLENAGFYCKKFGFECFHPSWESMTDENVAEVKKHGIKINVWTVNDMDALQKMRDWDIDGIFTNYAPICRAWKDGLKK